MTLVTDHSPLNLGCFASWFLCRSRADRTPFLENIPADTAPGIGKPESGAGRSAEQREGSLIPDARGVDGGLQLRLVVDAVEAQAAGEIHQRLFLVQAGEHLRGGLQRGELAMSRRFAARAVRHFADAARRGRTGTGGVIEGLSTRENDVLRMLAEGLTDREIATALVISPRTVETHVSNVLHKLNVRNRAEAAQRYREAR